MHQIDVELGVLAQIAMLGEYQTEENLVLFAFRKIPAIKTPKVIEYTRFDYTQQNQKRVKREFLEPQ